MNKKLSWSIPLVLLVLLFACGRVVKEETAQPTFTNAPFDATKVVSEEVTIGASTVTREVVSDQVILSAATGVSEDALRSRLPSGYEIVGKNSLANTYQIKIPGTASVSTAITLLASIEGVDLAGSNPVITTSYTPNDATFTSQWTYERWGYISSEATTAWDLMQGSSVVTIAVLDTGIDTDHTEFSGRLETSRQNFVAGNTEIEDDDGHGTAVAGVAVATGNNAKYMAGMNWKSKILIAKIMNSAGKGDAYSGANAMGWAAAKGAKVINCSFGVALDSNNAKDKAIIKHYEKAAGHCADYGALVAAAAGNEGKDAANQYPAALSLYTNTTVIAVGGYNRLGGRWIANDKYQSNYGTAVNISAPATQISSTWKDGGMKDNQEATSMAAPFVSGCAALILSIPEVSVYGLRNSIIESTDTLSTDKTIGGKLNAWKAVLKALYYSNKAVLTISSNPSGAAIYIDGATSGRVTSSEGTTRIVVSPGTHTVKLALSGYNDKEESISFTKGEEKENSWTLTPSSSTTTTTTSTTTTTISGVNLTGDTITYLKADNGNYWIRTDYNNSSSRDIISQIALSSSSSNWLNRAIYASPCLTQAEPFFDGVKDRSLSIIKNTSDLGAYQMQFTAYSGSKELRVTWKIIVPKDKKYAIWVASFESTGSDVNVTVDNPSNYNVRDVYFFYPLQPSSTSDAYYTTERFGILPWTTSSDLTYYSSSSGNRYITVSNSSGCLTYGFLSYGNAPLPDQFYLNSEMGYKSVFSSIAAVTLNMHYPRYQWIGMVAFHAASSEAAALFSDALNNYSTIVNQALQ
jgi:hypothetical protein